MANFIRYRSSTENRSMFASGEQAAGEQHEGDAGHDDQATVLGFCSFCVGTVGGSSKEKNWKGLAIAFLVITIVCLLITGAIFLTTTYTTVSIEVLRTISENDIFTVKSPQPWNGTWISDKYFTYVTNDDSLWIYDCDRREAEVLFRSDIIQQDHLGYGLVSPSARFLLIPTRQENIRPYYSDFHYELYEKTAKIASISFADGLTVPVSAVVYSHSDHLFAFIHHFDVYIYNALKRHVVNVTSDGSRATIHNGLVEWVYEYEIFNRNVLLFWSPTDRYLAFVKINLTALPTNHYLNYDLTVENDDQYSLPYPKYRDALPLLDVYIYHMKSGKTFRVPRPMDYDKLGSNVYVYHVVWYCSTCLSVVYGNREGNSSTIQLYELSQDKIVFKAYFVEETRRDFLISRFLRPYFVSNGAYAYMIRFDRSKADKSTGRAFARVARINFNQSYPQIDAFSPSHIRADEIVHVTNDSGVYFIGAEENNALEKHLYRWTYFDEQRSGVECLSCNESCGYVRAQFSRGKGTYHIRECLGPSIPYSTLHNRTHQLALVNNNDPFRVWIENRSLPFIDYFTVPLDNKSAGHGMIILPPQYKFNVTSASYPVIVFINHRLHDQRVNKKYPFKLFEFFQVIEDSIGIVLFDGHGTTGQDENFMKNNGQSWIERQSRDYIHLARYLQSEDGKFNGTLNHTRFGLKAEGPAAVIALKLLETNPGEEDGYMCAFLQSPVNDLSHYHAVFTERISGFTGDMFSSRRLRIGNRSLAIVHGTADEVVHFKHAATLAKSLVETSINFDFKVYPDVGHDFDQNPTVAKEFFRYQRRFFQQCLGRRVHRERKQIVAEEEYE